MSFITGNLKSPKPLHSRAFFYTPCSAFPSPCLEEQHRAQGRAGTGSPGITVSRGTPPGSEPTSGLWVPAERRVPAPRAPWGRGSWELKAPGRRAAPGGRLPAHLHRAAPAALCAQPRGARGAHPSPPRRHLSGGCRRAGAARAARGSGEGGEEGDAAQGRAVRRSHDGAPLLHCSGAIFSRFAAAQPQPAPPQGNPPRGSARLGSARHAAPAPRPRRPAAAPAPPGGSSPPPRAPARVCATGRARCLPRTPLRPPPPEAPRPPPGRQSFPSPTLGGGTPGDAHRPREKPEGSGGRGQPGGRDARGRESRRPLSLPPFCPRRPLARRERPYCSPAAGEGSSSAGQAPGTSAEPHRRDGSGQTKPSGGAGGRREQAPARPPPAPLTSRARAAPAASSKRAKWGSIAAAERGGGRRAAGRRDALGYSSKSAGPRRCRGERLSCSGTTERRGGAGQLMARPAPERAVRRGPARPSRPAETPSGRARVERHRPAAPRRRAAVR